MRAKLFGTKRRKVASVVVLVALVATSVAVALTIYSGVNGSGSGTIEGADTVSAVTITGTSNPVLTAGGATNMNVSVKNNDPSAAHTVTGLGGSSFSSSPASCAAHISIGGASFVGTSIPANGTISGTVLIGLAAGVPGECGSATWTVTFAGSTTP